MNQRSLLSEIEDMNFAISQLIYKGKSIDEVGNLLNKRGVASDKIEEIIKIVFQNYQGLNQILCSKTKRAVNFFIDMFLMVFFIIFFNLFLDHQYFEKYLFLIIICGATFIYILPEAIIGQTLGKFVTNTIVVDKEGKVPKIHLILFRTILRYNPLNAVIRATISERLTHDKWSGTYVVCKKRWRKIRSQSVTPM